MAVETTLVINPGSASRKYALAKKGRILLRGHFEVQDGEAVVTFYDARGSKAQQRVSSHAFAKTTDLFIAEAIARGIIASLKDITVVGLRIVAPGTDFQKSKRITPSYIKRLARVARVAPLHINPELKELRHIQKLLPRAARFAISDSAFHVTLPDVARRFTIPEVDAEKYDLYKFGYHGISVASVVKQSKRVFGSRPKHLVVCHLGSGSSVTAVKDGRSIDTTMGYSPLAGLAMATRVGDIDPGVLLALAKYKRFSLEQLSDYLNKRTGLLGLSGQTDDMKTLVERRKHGAPQATFAVEAYAHRVCKAIGASAATLGGLDAIVFTATIGERSWRLRSIICRQLAGLGVEFDVAKNRHKKDTGMITTPRSKVKVAVIETDELAELVRQTAALSA